MANQWAKYSEVNLDFIKQIESGTNKIKDVLETTQNAVNSVFGAFKSAIDVIKSTLSFLEKLGLSPFEKPTNPLESVFSGLVSMIDEFIEIFEMPNIYFLNLFGLQSPFFIKEKNKINSITFDDFYKKLYFHTIEDEGDANKPEFAETTDVGGILLLVHTSEFEFFFKIYQKFKDLFSENNMKNLDMEIAMESINKFPIYKRIKDINFVDVDESDINNAFSLNIYGNSYEGETIYIGSINYPNSIKELADVSDLNVDGLGSLKIEITNYKGQLFYNNKIIPTNQNILKINKNIILEILLEKDNGEEFKIKILLPKGDFDLKNNKCVFYTDLKGNIYRDPFLIVPVQVYKEKEDRKIEKDFNSIPPDYLSLELGDFLPFWNDIIDQLNDIRDMFTITIRTIADELQDIVDILDLYLLNLNNFINEFIDAIENITGFTRTLTSNGIYGVFAKGKGVEGMMEAISTATNKPNFKKGFYGGVFLVGEYNMMTPVAKLFGLK